MRWSRMRMKSRLSTDTSSGVLAAMPNDSKPVVLVADDEPSMVAMLSSHLRSKGFSVLEASDGDQAWELAHEHLPNLVLLDVMMPGMSGWEVCRKIREAVSLAHTGIVMLTGIGETLNELTSPLYGADQYLDKPFQFQKLAELVQSTLEARKAGAVGRPETSAEASEPVKEPKSQRRVKGDSGEEEAPKTKPGKAKAAKEKAPTSEPAAAEAATKAAPEAGKKKLAVKAKAASAPAAEAAPAIEKAPAAKAKAKAPAAEKAAPAS